MPTASRCSNGTLGRGAKPLPLCFSGWSFLSRSQSSNGNGIHPYLVGPIQNFSATYVFVDSHKEAQDGFYQRGALYHLRFN